MEAKVDTLTANLKEVVEENKRLKKTGENNLKYLVNLDRNTRRSNVILFGLSETEDLTIDGNHVNGDKAKLEALLSFIKVREKVEVCSHTRLGKESEDGDKIRPVKLIVKNSDMAALIVSNAKQLKALNQKLYFKPDKTAKEREEYQRLLTKKNELLEAHPAEEGQESRVVLKKGVLTVDGVEKDRYKTPQTIF